MFVEYPWLSRTMIWILMSWSYCLLHIFLDELEEFNKTKRSKKNQVLLWWRLSRNVPNAPNLLMTVITFYRSIFSISRYHARMTY